MEILVINGSPRKGNTYTLLQAFIKAAEKEHDVTYYDLHESKILPCEGCDACLKSGLCKHEDFTNEIIGKLKITDALVLGTPVYWWGMTAQMKAFIDKMYTFQSVGFKVHHKKIGLITVGGADIGNYQYKLIADQVTLISKFLQWDVVFNEEFKAYNIGDIAKDEEALKRAEKLVSKFD